MPFAGLFAKIAWGALFSRAKSNAVNDWHAIPPKVKLYLLGALAAVALFFVHQHVAKVKLQNQYSDGYKQAQKDDREAALDLKARIDALNAELAAKQRKIDDEAHARNAAAAGALRLSGPGKAACSIYPSATPGAGGHQPPNRTADATVDKLPDPQWSQLIGVPFDDEVTFAQAHDDYRSEALSWRSWHEQLVASWPHLFDTREKIAPHR